MKPQQQITMYIKINALYIRLFLCDKFIHALLLKYDANDCGKVIHYRAMRTGQRSQYFG